MEALGFAGAVVAALIGFAGILYLDRRRRAESAITRREERQRMEVKEKADRADLVLDSYDALVKRVEEDARQQRALNAAMSERLDECITERLEWREERLTYVERIGRLERKLRRAGGTLSDDEDTPPPAPPDTTS